MTFQSTKTYGHDLGLSCCFRQHRAKSHCNLLHGYALSFKFTFEADELDDRNWVQDFGGLKALKKSLVEMFDHKLVIADDDPQLDILCSLSGLGVADILVLPGVGCEMFAMLAFEMAESLLMGKQIVNEKKRVRVVSCECAEHGANSAIYIGEK